MWILTKMPKRSIQRCVTRFWRAKNQRSLGWHWQTIDLHKNIHILVMEHADSSTKYSFPTKNDWNELKRKEGVLRYLSELGSILIGTSYPTWIYQQMILIWANLSTCSMFTSIHWERCNSSTHLKSIKLFSWVGKKLPHRLSLSRRIMGSQNWWFGDPDKPCVFSRWTGPWFLGGSQLIIWFLGWWSSTSRAKTVWKDGLRFIESPVLFTLLRKFDLRPVFSAE